MATDTKPSCCPPSSACCAPTPPTSSCRPTEAADPAIDAAPCCGPAALMRGGTINDQVPGFQAWLSTAAGPAPRISTQLSMRDHLGACTVRWGINRMRYIVPPGLYAIGNPTADAPVLVTANYKMSYDLVRSVLSGSNVWLVVLETFGVNVWCAAGKGTFGTRELVERIELSGLSRVVSHRVLILPLLGAPGVAAHEVLRQTGFTVRYGPIRAADLPAYLDNGMTTTPAMRRLTFSFYERLVLVPVELVQALKPTALALLLLFAAGILAGGMRTGATAALAWLGAVLTGVVVGPLLLPWLPGRSFAIKGAVAGGIWSLAWYLIAGGMTWSFPETAASFLALPAVSSFYTLNFTGCTTYTSPSGVRTEMRLALPVMAGALLLGGVLLLAGHLL
ncbi:mercury methylation corrinoid protein HgcA [Trichlorobacter ammonificans]|uniref:Carbon monoxide dehydrogenase corrinoid/iron-sulfur protein n=1 Tax=Trichlorobacter ammonificans TaxID=2916410 RepID=A0ABM9D541_9BACT|nr:mercury methylation corrinoid protein HgcA [Trichlorobacter ammonificans]CAH2030357.1 putative carbon monoxide dehydrogenase corrinoid/iron-sulfur protein [Trichlorobacter ammonificans]